MLQLWKDLTNCCGVKTEFVKYLTASENYPDFGLNTHFVNQFGPLIKSYGKMKFWKSMCLSPVAIS